MRRASWDGRLEVKARVREKEADRGARTALRSVERRNVILGRGGRYLVATAKVQDKTEVERSAF